MDAAQIRNVTKTYSSAKESGGVFDLSFDVPDGGFVSLLGRSGSGKTTTLRLLAGFLRPDSGEIDLGGQTVAGSGRFVPPNRRDLAMVFQSYALWPHMTVGDNVAFGLRARGQSRRDAGSQAQEALDLVDMGTYIDRRPGELSGGQQQRVALARSLVLQPKLLLLDEPLSNLDAELRVQMRSQLVQLQRRTGIAFMYVTHDQDEALALSDQIVLLEEGRVLQSGHPEDLYFRPADLRVAKFLLRGGATVPGRVTDVRQSTVTMSTGHDDDLQLVGARGGAAALTTGSAVHLVLRPEAVRVVPSTEQAGDGWQAIIGTVQNSLFVGRENLLDVALDTGQVITVPDPRRRRFPPHERVQVFYRIDDAIVLAS